MARICIDCAPLLVRSAGVKTYLHHWLRALRQSEGESIATFLEPSHAKLDHAAGVNSHFFRLAALWALNRTTPAVVSQFAPACDVFHASNLLRRFPRRARLSATVHDLTANVTPEFHTPTQRAADEIFASNVLRVADGLICVSENTMFDVERILGIDRRKLTMIYPGVPDEYFRAGAPEAEAAARGLQIDAPYFLFVSTIEPRKNLDGLLSAWLTLPPAFRRANHLLVAGMPGWKSATTMARLRQLAGDESGIRYLGYVPEQLMSGLTAGARALVYPSFYEGFGIPVAQALAAGCPVIASGISSLPEIMGHAGLPVDPRSESEIASAILQVGDSESLRTRLQALGRQRASLFTWERAASQSLRYFESLTG